MRVLRCFLLVLAIASSAVGQTYTINTFAGGGLPVNIAGTSASLAPTSAVALDASGDIFIALLDYNVVLRCDARTGILTLVAGNGTAGFSGDSGQAVDAQLNGPTGVAVDYAGNVYIADAGNARIRKVSAGIITTVAGTGSNSFSGDNGPATSAQLNPIGGTQGGFGVALDASGNLYIADTGNYRVRKVANGIITTVAGNGTYGFSGDTGPATSATLSNPTGVVLDDAYNLYIADGNRIREVSGGIITTVAGNGFIGPSGDNGPAIKAELNGPNGVALDNAGDLFIADTGNSRVREISNGIITTVAGNGTFGLSGDGGPATSAQLNSPFGVAVDSLGNVFIADFGNNRVRKVTGNAITTVVGGGSSIGDATTGAFGYAINAQLFFPEGVALDSAGDLYIADFDNGRIRKVSSPSSVITTVAGNGIFGFGGDNGPAANAELDGPSGLAVDLAGNLYIADSGNNRVRMVSTGVITTVAGNGTPGFSGDHSSATGAELYGPSGVAVDANGNLYIADYFNNRVRMVSNGVIITVAGNGTPGSGGDNGPAISAQLSGPKGVALDAAGDLYIADSANNRIREVSGGVITTVAGSGAFALGDGAPATKAVISLPAAVAVDIAGNLYIADSGNNRIRRVTGGIISTIVGDGNASFSGDGGPSIFAEIDDPYGITVNSSGTVYFADTANNRVRFLFPAPGNACTYTLSPFPLPAVATSGGNVPVTVQTAAGCTWVAQGPPSWITLSGTAVNSGPGSVTLTVVANTGATRSGVISIAGVPVLVTQQGTSPVLSINAGGVINDANYTAPVAPGSIAAAFGDFLLSSQFTAPSGSLPTDLSGLSLEFPGGRLAPLFYASGTQVNFQIPWELAGQSTTTLTASLSGQTSAAQTVNLAPFAPAIFSINSQGSGQGAIIDAISYRLLDSTNPATAGVTYVAIYCTGLGAVTNQPPTGSPAPVQSLSYTNTTPTVTIGGVQVLTQNVEFSGLAPGFVGLYQVNAQVPATSARGDAVPVTITIGGIASNTVTIAVQSAP
ncbi:MAG: hypothetical protein WAJ87_25615 [Bryobacteraceae bacterium]